MPPEIIVVENRFLDNEDWRFDLTLTREADAGPIDLTGSRIFVTFRNLADGAFIATCDSHVLDGALTILNETAGTIRINSRAVRRAWRADRSGPAAFQRRQTVEGDLIRFIDDGVEALTRIRFIVTPGTTQDEINGPGAPLPEPELPDLADVYEDARA